jgi:hypothetical protein
LHAQSGITFQDTLDRFDYLKVAVLDLVSGRRIALVRHARNTTSGTEVHVLPQRFTSATHLPGVIHIRRPDIWGERTTACASDSKKFGVFRYRWPGVGLPIATRKQIAGGEE